MKVSQVIVNAAGDLQLITCNDYKAPHALRATPPRRHFKRIGRFRLFKGHRP